MMIDNHRINDKNFLYYKISGRMTFIFNLKNRYKLVAIKLLNVMQQPINIISVQVQRKKSYAFNAI
jgi:hypothetical protein